MEDFSEDQDFHLKALLKRAREALRIPTKHGTGVLLVKDNVILSE